MDSGHHDDLDLYNDDDDVDLYDDDFFPSMDRNHPSQFSTKISLKSLSHRGMHFCIAYVASLSQNKKWSPEKE